MKLATMPAADTAPAACPPVSDRPDDEAQKRAIADAVWTDLLWLMPTGRSVTVVVRNGRVAVELGPPGPMPEAPAY